MGDALQHRANDLCLPRSSGEPEKRAARAIVPNWRAEAQECRHKPHTPRIGTRSRELVRVRRRRQQTEIVAEPFNAAACRQHDGFYPPRDLVAGAPGNDREGPARSTQREARAGCADAEIEHPARPESCLSESGPNATLADERSLLVPGDAR